MKRIAALVLCLALLTGTVAHAEPAFIAVVNSIANLASKAGYDDPVGGVLIEEPSENKILSIECNVSEKTLTVMGLDGQSRICSLTWTLDAEGVIFMTIALCSWWENIESIKDEDCVLGLFYEDEDGESRIIVMAEEAQQLLDELSSLPVSDETYKRFTQITNSNE